MRGWVLLGAVLLVAADSPAFTAEGGESVPSAMRGQEFVRKPVNPPFWSLRAYQEAWKRWGIAKKPADYDRAFRERYGLHAPQYENGGLPMGFIRSRGLLGLGLGLGNDCLLCHAGTVAGQTIIGLGNASLDMQSLYEELTAADGLDPIMPLPLCRVRGTSEASNFAVYLMQFRDAELRHRIPVKYALCENLCEDVPAWWHYKRKKTIYHLGVADSRSVRTLMPFLLIPGNTAASIKHLESEFAEIRAYLLSLEPPRYPFEIDRTQAEQGKAIFERNCQRCHGSYGAEGHYPNKLVPLEVIGTDATLARGFAPEGVAHYLESWFGRERGPAGEPYHGLGGGGYQAPPLDGIWATAPYFHNGSVPTVYHVLNSSGRPRVFTRSFRGDALEYDQRRVGLKFQELARAANPSLPAFDRRKVYDTTQPGRGNGGHIYGDALTESERMAVIEYLKSL
jgi:mono/diheme cytochrome c family protein